MHRTTWPLASWTVIAAMFASFVSAGEPLSGTTRLGFEGDLAELMLDRMHSYLDRATEASTPGRSRHWQRDFSSAAAYHRSVEPNRKRLRKILGVEEPDSASSPVYVRKSTPNGPNDSGPTVQLEAVRWTVLPGVEAAGLAFSSPSSSSSPRKSLCVLIPDATQTPAQCAGLQPGNGSTNVEFKPDSLAAFLLGHGLDVVVLTTIDRDSRLSTVADGTRRTNISHREFIHRQAFMCGRSLVGYEVQSVLALLSAHLQYERIGLFGYGDGGFVALCAAALDQRIDVVAVSGSFAPSEQTWEQPLDRDFYGLLREFGTAEIASLIAPRTLLVEPSEFPRVVVVPGADGKSQAAPGVFQTPEFSTVQAEVGRVKALTAGLAPWIELVGNATTTNCAATPELRERLVRKLIPHAEHKTVSLPAAVTAASALGDPRAEQEWQFRQWVENTQRLVRESPKRRAELWSATEKTRRAHDAANWSAATKQLREQFETELLGRIDEPMLPTSPQTRQIYDQPKFTGYEVVLNVFSEIFAEGILLIPKGIEPGDRRPVVVCQHGLEGRPVDCIDAGGKGEQYYQRFAKRLVEQGYVVFCPQNGYLGGERFRLLVRKSHPLGLNLWSFIVPQHRQIVAWLGTLPMVDPRRIAFYGLSYGGKSAMRVPAVVDGYCLSICSADFNEWVWKSTSLDYRGSYLGTHEYEMPEWNLANTFNYAEMASLIAPRPFMVERGHRDGVSLDEQVAFEYAKVRLLYADLRISEATEIEFFDGPHTIHGVGTFRFLDRHLRPLLPGPTTAE